MATNSHSVKYETLRFGHGQLVFLLYNLINKVLTTPPGKVWFSLFIKVYDNSIKKQVKNDWLFSLIMQALK